MKHERAQKSTLKGKLNVPKEWDKKGHTKGHFAWETEIYGKNHTKNSDQSLIHKPL